MLKLMSCVAAMLVVHGYHSGIHEASNGMCGGKPGTSGGEGVGGGGEGVGGGGVGGGGDGKGGGGDGGSRSTHQQRRRLNWPLWALHEWPKLPRPSGVWRAHSPLLVW